MNYFIATFLNELNFHTKIKRVYENIHFSQKLHIKLLKARVYIHLSLLTSK